MIHYFVYYNQIGKGEYSNRKTVQQNSSGECVVMHSVMGSKRCVVCMLVCKDGGVGIHDCVVISAFQGDAFST